MTRRRARTLQGVVLAVGAPVGWLVIGALRGESSAGELMTNPGLYIYMLVSTMIAFGVFGMILGEREDSILETNRQLEELAITDPLTGLRNARYFHARLDEEHQERLRTGRPLAVVVLDLDHFKRVNDEYGHLVGDDVLTTVGRAIASVTRQGETEARVGGEEFAVLLPGSDGDAAVEAAERVRTAIAAAETPLPAPHSGTIRVTISAGVASTAELNHLDAIGLYRAADEALFRAKAEGRDRTINAAADRRYSPGA